VENKRGKFEIADGGTLFLDEIGDMSLLTQAKVLRVLQESRFTRLGGSQEVRVDVRVIAATNKNLEDEIAASRFRQDLLFRLNVIPIRVPGLDQRREDVPLLVEEFMRQFARRTGVKPKPVSPEAIEILKAHDWPGNVREVRNLVGDRKSWYPTRRSPRWCSTSVRAPGRRGRRVRHPAAGSRVRARYVGRVVEDCGGNMSKAARVLGLERSHLYRKLRALGLRSR
jgi:two-component system nitrogen regulation response regulator NtrX